MEKKNNTGSTITAVVDQFQEVGELKTLIRSLESDISYLVGEETRVLVATRKGKSVSNRVVKNRNLCTQEETHTDTEKCGARKCKSCKLLGNKGDTWMVNGKPVETPNRPLNCKTKNAIYLAQCTLCGKKVDIDDTYTGQTQQPIMHKRSNGHRS